MLNVYSSDSESDDSEDEEYSQHFPNDVTNKMLFRNQKAIGLIDEDNGESFYVEVHSTKRNKKLFKKEKLYVFFIDVCRNRSRIREKVHR
ncbi:hypothetical protein RYX36_006851 [Vicia faba]